MVHVQYILVVQKRIFQGWVFFPEKTIWKYPEKSGRNGNFRKKLEHTVAFKIFRQVSGL